MVGAGLLRHAGREVRRVLPAQGTRVFVITSPNVRRHWGAQLEKSLQQAKVPSQLDVFEKGGHGFSLHWAQGKPCGAWPDLFLAWAATHGFKA